MKFTITQEVLVEHLQRVLGPTLTKQNLPILSALLITATTKHIRFTATDLDITIISIQETPVEETGQVAIPMKRLFSIVRELPAQPVTIEKSKNSLLIRCEKIEFKINTLDEEEFPHVQEAKGVSLIKVDPQGLKEMIRLTSFCVGYEDVNYVLGGILFEIADTKLQLVATDGKRLAYIQKSLPANQPEVTSKVRFILPNKAITELYKLIREGEEDLFIFSESNRVGFDFKNTQFIARPIEGEFPNYEQYIPKDSKDRLEVNRQQLLFALRRASLLSTTDYQGVKLELKKSLVTISKATPQLGEVKETLEGDYSGSHLEIGFNPAYLIDVLRNLEDERVVIEFFGPDKPAVLKKEGYVYLLLPMKL